MKGALYIDNVDMYLRFGAVFISGGCDDILTFPALKEPVKNDWPEEDGVEVDLSEPKLDSKEITLDFFAVDAFGFVDFVSKPEYHVFRITSLGREWKLRLSSQTDNKVWEDSTRFSLKFVQDEVEVPEEYPPTSYCGVIIPKCSYEIDGVALRDYGITVIEAKDDVLKSPAAKRNMLRQIQIKDGQIYDVKQLFFSTKDVTFKCEMCADSIEQFWKCYDAFFYDLIQPDERALFVEYTDEEYPCYYKKSSGFKILSLSGTIRVSFSFTLVFTVFRIGETDYILGSEDGERIVLEDDGETCIDMKYYAG